MKVALVHDYLKEYGGAERVLETFHELYPDATVFTSVYLPEYLGPHRDRFKGWKIRTSWLQNLPFKAKLISPMRLLSPFAFRSFDFKGYDVVIVSATGAYFPNVIKTKKIKQNHSPFAISHKPVHICYCHTPPRYLYGYATAREWKKNIVFRVLGAVANHFLRIVDFHASQNVDYYIANSEEVRGRIQKFYRREATVIYPPIDINSKPEARNPKQIKNTKYKIPDTEYYVAGGRLARPKHIDLIVRACKEQKLPLKVFGKAFAGYGEELEALTKNNEPRTKKSIELLGEVSDEEKWELLANAKAYIFASEDEDFGILPVEAMAAGTPVIAYRSGGVQETVVDGKTGVFFDELSVSSLASAIKRFEKTKFDDSISTKHARQFSSETFKKKIDAFVKEHSK